MRVEGEGWAEAGKDQGAQAVATTNFDEVHHERNWFKTRPYRSTRK